MLLAPCATGEIVTLGHRSLADAVIVKPLNPVSLRRILAQDAHAKDVQRVHAHVPALELPSVVVGSSAEMREVWRLAIAAAHSN